MRGETLMNELLVSVDIVTASAKIAVITSLLGIEPSPTKSHDQGSPRSRGTWPVTVWSLVSPVDRSAPLEEHLSSLLTMISKAEPEGFARLPADAKIYLSIGILCKEPNTHLVIPAGFLKEMVAFDMSIEVSFYVCEERDD